jgi:hypothetical protein
MNCFVGGVRTCLLRCWILSTCSCEGSHSHTISWALFLPSLTSDYYAYWQAFSLDFNLRSHMRTHTGEKYHACPYEDCGKRYAHEYKLRAHMRSYHDKVCYYMPLVCTLKAECMHCVCFWVNLLVFRPCWEMRWCYGLTSLLGLHAFTYHSM